MPSREEIAAQVIGKFGFPLENVTDIHLQWNAREIWDALIDAKVELAEREQRPESATKWINKTSQMSGWDVGRILQAVLMYAAPEELAKVLEAYRADSELRVKELSEALRNMIGWAQYGEESDPWYFSEEQAPTWQKDLAGARAVLSEGSK